MLRAAMLSVTKYNVWIEVLTLPYLFVLSMFLYLRYATTAEVNKRFRTLSVSTFAATAFEVATSLLISGWGKNQAVNLIVRTLYYAVVNLNAYHLMQYVAAYVGVDKQKQWDFLHKFFLLLSMIMLLLNLVPGISGFFFSILPDGSLRRGPYNILCRSIFVLYFLAVSFMLQITHKQAYKEKMQFFMMTMLGFVLILSFVVQYMFMPEILITYAVATVLLFIIFFYYEAPSYRQMSQFEVELEEARVRAENSTRMTNAANRAKSDFLANTSHEIRTPMNAILGMNEMILNECRDSEVRQYSLDIRHAGNHLLSIINNILDISKIESGKMEIFNTDYHLWQLLKDVEESVFESMEEKNLKFIVDIDKNLPEHLYGDQDHIRQILTNLLDNALKYTEHGSIAMRVSGGLEERDGGEQRVNLKFIVEDTGLGIRQEDLTRLFKSFQRVNLNETQNIQGAGLGLTLIRYLLELMGGRVEVESEYGKGTVFTVYLMQQLSREGFHGTIKDYEAMGTAGVFSQENNYAGETLIFTPDDNEYEGPFMCPNAEILFVDDTPVNLVVAKGMLNATLAKIDTAESGAECLEKLKAKNYNIVFLDHRMPDMDGVETLKLAREIRKDIVYVALTANSGAGLREEYVNKYGFDDYVPKPIKSKALHKILWKYLPDDMKERGGGDIDYH